MSCPHFLRGFVIDLIPIDETVTNFTTSFAPSVKDVGLNNTVGLLGGVADLFATGTEVGYAKINDIDYEDKFTSTFMKYVTADLARELAGTLRGALQAMHNGKFGLQPLRLSTGSRVTQPY